MVGQRQLLMGEVQAGRNLPCQSPGILLLAPFSCFREAENLPWVNAAARAVCAHPLPELCGTRPSPPPALGGCPQGSSPPTEAWPATGHQTGGIQGENVTPSLQPIVLLLPCSLLRVSLLSVSPCPRHPPARFPRFPPVPTATGSQQSDVTSNAAPSHSSRQAQLHPGAARGAPPLLGSPHPCEVSQAGAPSPPPPRQGSAAGGFPGLTLVPSSGDKSGWLPMGSGARWPPGHGCRSPVPRPVPPPRHGAEAPAKPPAFGQPGDGAGAEPPREGGDVSLGTAVSFLEPARSLSRLSLLVSARQPGNTT